MVFSKPLGDSLGMQGRTYSAYHWPQGRIQNRTGDNHPEKIPIFPHTVDFPRHKLKNFIFHVRSALQLLTQIPDFFRDSESNQCKQQTFLSTEITMDQAFCAAGAGSDFASRGCVIAARCEKPAGCQDQCTLSGETVAFPFLDLLDCGHPLFPES